MEKSRKLLCLLLTVLLMLTPMATSLAVEGNESEPPLSVEITTDKEKYGTFSTANFTVKITNVSDEPVSNVRAVVSLDKLTATGKNSQLQKEIESLASGETLEFTYSAMLDAGKASVNFFERIILFIVQLFKSILGLPSNGVDDGVACVEGSKTVLFGKYEAGASVKVAYKNSDDEKGIVYADGVIELDNQTAYQQNGSRFVFPITEETKKFAVGTVFLLPDKTPYKVSSISTENGSYVVETEDPTIEETVKSVDIQGTVTLNPQDFILEEGVKLVTPQGRNLGISRQSLGGFCFEVSTEIDEGLEIYANVSIKEIAVDFKADIDIEWFNLQCKEVWLKTFIDAEITGGIKTKTEGNLTNPRDGVLVLAKIPVLGFPGIAIYAEIALAYNIEGKFEIKVTTSGTAGFGVYENQPRGIFEFETNLETPEIELSGRIGPKVSGLLEICNKWNLLDFAVFMGGEIKATQKLNNTNTDCKDIDLFAFGELTALYEGVIGEWLDLKYKYEFWNESNSPLRKNFHFENGKLVSACTVPHELIMGTVKERQTENPLAGVLVEAYNEKDVLFAQAHTGENGDFSTRLPEGSYTLRFSLEGYTTAMVDITVYNNTSVTLDEIVYLEATGDDGVTNWDFIVPVTHKKTVPDGYIPIFTIDDLYNIPYGTADGMYILMNDIEFSKSIAWQPFGIGGITLDGNGYSIRNLYTDGQGLFSYANGATIKNLALTNVIVNSSTDNVGALAGRGYFNDIDNCFTTGYVKGKQYVGGIIGIEEYSAMSSAMSSSSMKNSYSLCTVNGDTYVGGICGMITVSQFHSGTIQNCYNAGSIKSLYYAGGITGYAFKYGDQGITLIDNCYNAGEVFAENYVGGIVGQLSRSMGSARISNSYNTGKIEGISSIGGLSGSAGADIQHCYNIGEVAGDTEVGGIVGTPYVNRGFYGIITAYLFGCYCINTTSTAVGGSGGTFTDVNELTENEMKDSNNFLRFDFDTIWAIDPNKNNGYPYLRTLEPREP